MPDGGQVALDWAHPIHSEPTDCTPTVVVLHGLWACSAVCCSRAPLWPAGSHEPYVRALLHALIRPPSNHRAVVLNARGCAKSEVLTPKLFCGANTDDLRSAVHHIQQRVPSALLMAVGSSLGANILAKVHHGVCARRMHRD
jgi:uncharacterized protein